MQFWKEMEGKTVAGRYALGTLLRSTEQSAWFAAKDDRQKPWVAFLTKSASDEDQVLKNLEAASRVKHANVVELKRRADSASMICRWSTQSWSRQKRISPKCCANAR